MLLHLQPGLGIKNRPPTSPLSLSLHRSTLHQLKVENFLRSECAIRKPQFQKLPLHVFPNNAHSGCYVIAF